MSGACLRPWSRLTGPRQYDPVFAQPKRQSDRYFTILSRSNSETHGRLGLAVSKRVDKRAVGRNRIKRMIRESFRAHQQQLKGLDLVVIAKPPARHADNAALSGSLEKLWSGQLRRHRKQPT
jgi:ribonuclease P protein component